MPTVFRIKTYRFFFFSREESRKHIHVSSTTGGEAKVWIEPEVCLAENSGFSDKELNEILSIAKTRKGEIENEWNKHFKLSK